MKKYSFLVYHKDYENFLKNIQDLGVLHVIEKKLEELENEKLREKYSLIARLDKAIKRLDKYEVEEKPATSETDGIKILEELEALEKNAEDNAQKKAIVEKELKQIEPWGEFSWDNIEKLASAGIRLRFLQAPQRKFEEEIKNNFFVEEVNSLSGHSYFVLMQQGDEKIDIDAEEIALPKQSYSELKKQLVNIEAIEEKSEEVFQEFASKYMQLLLDTKKGISADLAFDKVKLYTKHEAEDKLMILEGWTPKDKLEELNNFLETSGVYYELADPEPVDAPPIKLKNNRFAKLYEAIGELYTFPNYGEIDLTPFFAPFYMLFFGFCLGDAGYGLLITIGTIIGLFKVNKKVKPLMKLGMYLGIATTIMGIVGGTFFGIMLKDTTWTWLATYKELILDDQKLMLLSLGLGYIQVIFGKFIAAANQIRMYGFKHSLAQFGWITIVAVTIPSFALAKFDIIANTQLGYNIALISLILGAIPAFFYNQPGKNPLINFGSGIWDAYNNASGLLGDVLSYIRLFALGISSAILGNVFNSLAVQFAPENIVGKIIVMVLILAFGHGLNFFMAALGSFVHPLRLTFVEFYKNAGFMGGGRKYEPFSN